MKPHVQAIFKVSYDIDQVKAASVLFESKLEQNRSGVDFDTMSESEFDNITESLHKEFIVKILDAGEGLNRERLKGEFMRIPLNDNSADQIKEWIKSEGKSSLSIALDKNEVTVEVMAECCSGCSSGIHVH